MKTCLVLYNPNSGNHQVEKFLPQIEAELEKKGYEVMIVATERKGHATEIIETAPNVDLVMSFGGDGTFNEVMTGNFRRKEKLLLTHIPVGTTNAIKGNSNLFSKLLAYIWPEIWWTGINGFLVINEIVFAHCTPINREPINPGP